MAAIERGRGRGGMRGGRGGGEAGRGRGVWRGGPPPGSTSYPSSRGASPAIPGTGPRTSINDHMNDMKKVVQDPKARGFQTDTDISKSANLVERELKPWVPDEAPANGAQSNGLGAGGAGNRDADTFGAGVSNVHWDQFETNERLFGTKTSFQEELYTTKLNKSGADFKKREKEAERLAAEIMGTASKNVHIAEERGQVEEGATKDEEEKYSGVVRAPGAYVPPGARRGVPAGGPAPAGRSPALPPSAASPASTGPKTNGSAFVSPAPHPTKLSPESDPTAAIALPPGPTRSTSEDPSVTLSSDIASATAAPQAAEAPAAAGKVHPPVGGEGKGDGQLGGVMTQWRQFVGTEKEKIEAKKQSVMKSERDRQLADLKKFHANFKVPLPMPKDILPILSKDETKQKDIEAKAADALERALEAKKVQGAVSPVKPTAPVEPVKVEQPKTALPKKPFMKIPEIPPFNPAKRKSAAQVAPVLHVPETASQNIPPPLASSPTPSAASHASGSQSQAKLNPKASTFVFKPNPGAAVFKPGQSSGSPAQTPRQMPSASVAPSPALVPAAPKNMFFKDKTPERITVDPRTDFNPWKHGSGNVPSASSVGLQWPYTGRKSHGPPYGGQMGGPHGPGFSNGEEDPSSPSPHAMPPQLMPGMPPNYPPYGYRFNQPGMPPHGMPSQMGSPMFSPGPQFAPLPGQPMSQPPQHMGPGPGPQLNGMPMYFQGGMPPNSGFMPQHMPFNPHTPQRHGPGPGGPNGPPSGMFYPSQGGTPHQTPQLQHSMPFPAQPPQGFNHQVTPMQVAQPPPGSGPIAAQTPNHGGPPSGPGGAATPSAS
ncbi:hypothetical protein IAU60_004423 [Kwoniella sp. DSM 27419]